MTKLTEFAIVDASIQLFELLGHSHIHAPDIVTDSETLESLCGTLLPKLMSGEVRVAA